MNMESWRKVQIEQTKNGYIVTLGFGSHDEKSVFADLDDALRFINDHFK